VITGQYPLTHGVYINDVELRPKGLTLGEAFRDAGYRTAYIGKWHLYGSPDGRYGRRRAYIPPESRFGFEYWKAAECIHEYDHSLYYEGEDSKPKYWPGYDALAQTLDACRYIREQATGPAPFFLTLAWGPPHFPLNTAPESIRRSIAIARFSFAGMCRRVSGKRRLRAPRLLRAHRCAR
jgi:arylsulfatase A-like enzyme